MKIWIDINHIPQFNFYKRLILRLSAEGHTVLLTVLDRGKLLKIARKELADVKGVEVVRLGKHKMSKASAIFDANLLRLPAMYLWARKQHIDIAFSNGMQLAIVSHMLGIPNYSFDDDPQTMDFGPKVRYNTECNFCVFRDDSIAAPARVLRCTKEWAYLAPEYFEPHVEALEKYGVEPKRYVFLREVTVGTVNYAGQASGAVHSVQQHIQALRYVDDAGREQPMKVLFSLEEKHRRSEYPEDWILLQEPIEDIHSLIYYSAGLVSSGDSMAREAALLGVPSYYLGIRYSMPANAAASEVAGLQNQQSMPFADWCAGLSASAEDASAKQQVLREKISEQFIDINEYMHSLVEQVANQKKK